MVIRLRRALCGVVALAAPLAGCASTGSTTDAGAGVVERDAGRCDDQPGGKCAPGATCWEDCFVCIQGYGHVADFTHPGKPGNRVLTRTCQNGYYSPGTVDCFGGISEGPQPRAVIAKR